MELNFTRRNVAQPSLGLKQAGGRLQSDPKRAQVDRQTHSGAGGVFGVGIAADRADPAANRTQVTEHPPRLATNVIA